MKEEKLKHLELIQGVINRMGQNSFLIKTWTVTLTAAMFALAAKDGNVKFVYPAFFPLIVFALLDSYYLSRERVYRQLYNDVSSKPSVDFSLSIKEPNEGYDVWFRSMISRTIVVFYGGVGLTVYLVMRSLA